MKVVLFCGGLGRRLRQNAGTIPKPLVSVGHQPILWHLMRYYAHHGHKDFILCLGYRGDLIREFFLTYNECMTNDFTLSEGGRQVKLHGSSIQDWRITLVDTGLNTTIGERLLRVRDYLAGESVFLANYSDGLSDLPLNDQIADFERKNAIAGFAAVHSRQTFHTVHTNDEGYVTGIGAAGNGDFMINGGFFVLRQQIFDYINEGEELVEQPFSRLIEQRRLAAFPYHGFWQAMDTFKDKIAFDRMEARGNCPWAVWKSPTQMNARVSQ